MAKIRLDQLLVEKNYAESREKAKAIIMTGIVYVNGQKNDKPGCPVNPDADVEVRGSTLRYVSRGGLKLEKALQVFDIDVFGKTCIDCGASTGGFTDVLIQNGASKVYAVDVGYGQLAWKLRNDPRVVNMEKTNVRYLSSEQIPEILDIAVIDVAFISLKLIFPAIVPLLSDECDIVSLIKPQFEAGREYVGKKGVIHDPDVHKQVITSVLEFAPTVGLYPHDLDFSPIKGPEGNIEFLCHFRKFPSESSIDIDSVVENSHLKI